MTGGAGNNLTMLNFPTRRAWKLKVSQVPCSCGTKEVMKAPDGCLQYHSGISGNLKSFNYDGIGCFSNDHICDPDNIKSCEFVAGFYILFLWEEELIPIIIFELSRWCTEKDLL